MDLTFLKPLYDRSGPYASVYADLTRTTEDAGKAAELRWRALREELQTQGTPEATVRAVETAVVQEMERRRSEGLVLFAAGDEVVWEQRLDHAPRTPFTRFSLLPHVLPYLAERGERFPHLVAVVDRRGGEIDCYDPEGRRRHIDVTGDEDYPIRKVKAGDWNQSRFQRSAENVWKANLKKVAREVDRAARTCAAEAVVVAGEPKARTAVMEEVSEGVLQYVVESENNEGLDGELSRILDLKTTERILTVAERFERELANGGRAVTGLAATVDAVRRGQVESLLLNEDPATTARLWVGPDLTHVATTAEELREMGVEDPQEERADAALLRSVAMMDGELVILPPDGPNASHGVGAVLRFSDRFSSPPNPQ